MRESDCAARCGIYCGACEYRDKTDCPGCIEAGGTMFWGTCSVATCCVERGHGHCGLCEEFPCEQLTAFAYDKEQGDRGERIRRLEAWKAKGDGAWLKEQSGR